MNPTPGPQLSGLVYRLVLLVALTMFIAVGLSALTDVRQVIHHNIENEYLISNRVALSRIGGFLDTAKEDLVTISGTPTLDRLLNTLPDSSDYQPTNEAAAASLLNFAQQHDEYYRIRYLDETGQEQLRVERTNGDELAVIPREQLQNRVESTYFTDTAKSSKGVIYISTIESDQEGAQPVTVLRLAKQVFDHNNLNKGQVVTDLYAQSILSYLVMSQYHSRADLMMVDKTGHYLYTKDKLSTQATLASDQPTIWSHIIANGNEGSYFDQATKQTVVYNKLYFTTQNRSTNTNLSFGQFNGQTVVDQSQGNYWLVIGFIDNQQGINIGNLLQYRTFYGLIMVLIVIVVSGDYLSRRVTRTTQTILNEAERFKLAVDNTYDHVIITDPEGVIMYANKSAERITGFTTTEMVGKKAGSKELWGGQMPAKFYQQMWHTIKEEKKVFVAEITNRRKNGQIYVAQVSLSPILNNRGGVEFFVGIERDITREKEIDRTKTEFVSLASHQLRTPLSAIGWYTEMLLSGDAGQVSDQQRDFLDEISRGNRRMVNLVNALLNVSRLELGTFALEPIEANLAQLVQEEIKELQPQINERHHQVTTEFATDIPRIQVDKMSFSMIVQNLLSNAIKYTANQGQIKVGLRRTDGSILLTVQDNGYGIPSNQQEKIFTKLFRADNVLERDVEGTGLGLYIVKEIITVAGGKIWFESKEGQGTTFYVTMPLSGMKAKVGSKKLS